jgi:hypothetical protein
MRSAPEVLLVPDGHQREAQRGEALDQGEGLADGAAVHCGVAEDAVGRGAQALPHEQPEGGLIRQQQRVAYELPEHRQGDGPRGVVELRLAQPAAFEPLPHVAAVTADLLGDVPEVERRQREGLVAHP